MQVYGELAAASASGEERDPAEQKYTLKALALHASQTEGRNRHVILQGCGPEDASMRMLFGMCCL
jgi:hypothetical protein